MPTVELTLSETTFVTLRKAAEQRRQLLEEVIEDALDAFLEPVASIEPAAGNGSSAPDGDWRRAKIHTEAEAWRSVPTTVRRSYGDDFVAVHGGRVVDHDGDRLTLYRRLRARFGDIPILITPADAVSPREFQFLSPRVERPR